MSRQSIAASVASIMASLFRYERREAPRNGPSKKALRRLTAGIGIRLTHFVAGTGVCGAKGCENPIRVDHSGTGVRFCCRAHRHLRHNANGKRARKFAARAARRASCP